MQKRPFRFLFYISIRVFFLSFLFFFHLHPTVFILYENINSLHCIPARRKSRYLYNLIFFSLLNCLSFLIFPISSLSTPYMHFSSIVLYFLQLVPPYSFLKPIYYFFSFSYFMFRGFPFHTHFQPLLFSHLFSLPPSSLLIFSILHPEGI